MLEAVIIPMPMHKPRVFAMAKECQGHQCAYCLRRSDDLTRDHVLRMGHAMGDHDMANIVLACRQCNAAKKNRSMFTMLNRKVVRPVALLPDQRHRLRVALARAGFVLHGLGNKWRCRYAPLFRFISPRELL